MTSITRAGTDSPAWRAAVVLGRLDHVRRVAQHDSPFRTADQRLLWLFSDGEARTLREIAEELNLEQSTVNRQANAAVKAGHLKKFREPEHSSWLFMATDEAAIRFSKDLQHHLEILQAASEEIPAGQRDKFFDHLERFVAAYGDKV